MFTTTQNNGDVSVWGAQLEQGYYPSAYTPTTNSIVTSTNNLYVPSGSIYSPSIQSVVSSTATLSTNGDTGGLLINTVAAANKGLVVRGAASQTGDLQQWQNSSGTVLGMFNAYGTLTANNRIYAGWAAFGSGYGTSASASNVVLIAKGSASQTANLTEWQNSAGSTLAYMDPNGNFVANYVGLGLNAGLVAGGSYFLRVNYAAGNTINLGTSAQVTGTQVQVTNSTASNIALTVKAAASQTANLQEWQLSDGTVIASISKLNPNNNSAYLYVGGGADWKVGSNELHFGRSGGTAYINHPTSFTISSVYGGSLNIKGAASQTSNLQEWQNSSGTILAKVDVNGAIKAAGLNIAGQEVSSNINLLSGYRYFVDTTAARTLTLPASPSLGDEIQVFDASGAAATNNVTINSNSGKINGSVQNAVLDVNGGVMAFIYTGSTYGWRAG